LAGKKTHQISGNAGIQNIKGSSIVAETCINGSFDNASIAESFRAHLADIYSDSSDLVVVDEFKQQYSELKSDNSNDNANNFSFDLDMIEQSVKLLKLNKAAGHDGIVSEHIIHGHPALLVHFKLLFNMILKTGYVPNDFGKGVVIPIIKDKTGNPSVVDNYRPITLSPVISKVFEHCLITVFSTFISSSNLQFGFKPGLSCSDAIFTLRSVWVTTSMKEVVIYVSLH